MTTATEEFAMPMDLSPEHSAPVVTPSPMAEPQEASQQVATLETLDGPGPETSDTEASEYAKPEHEQWKEHNGILYIGLVPPDFTHVEIVNDIHDESCLTELLESEVVYEVVKFDGNDSTVAIRPDGCKTADGLYWLNPDEYEVAAEESQGDLDNTPVVEDVATEESIAENDPGHILTRSQQLRFKHHEQIIHKQMAVDRLLEAWEEAKKDAANAKKSYETAVEALQRLIRTPPSQLPLFQEQEASQPTDSEEDELDSEEAASETESDDVDQVEQEPATSDSSAPAADPEAWRATSLEELIVYGLSDAVVKKFAEGGIHTLGDACDFQMGERGRPLTDIKGIGQAKIEKFEEASMAWHRDHPMPSAEASEQPAAEQPELTPQQALEEECHRKPLSELVDHEFNANIVERLAAINVKNVDDAIALLRDQEDTTHWQETVKPEELEILSKVVDAWEGHFFEEHS